MEFRVLCDDLKIIPGVRWLKNQKGVTLLELIVVIAIFGILAGIASRGLDGWHRSRLVAATGSLLADLQTTRMYAMTESNDADTRGYGLRFVSNNSYKVFEFADNDSDFTYDDETEEMGGYENEFGNGIVIDPDPTGEIVLYDNHGMSRATNWSSIGNDTYVVRHTSLDRARCVVISQVRIREGVWDGTDCQVR